MSEAAGSDTKAARAAEGELDAGRERCPTGVRVGSGELFERNALCRATSRSRWPPRHPAPPGDSGSIATVFREHGRQGSTMATGDARVFYFAYGSNADPERFRARVGAWRSRRPGWLDGHRLRFADSVQSEGGGGAVIDPAPAAVVAGVLFEITTEQLEATRNEGFILESPPARSSPFRRR